jgi:multicomponent Na+:H+ antiporter subunit E
MPINPGIVKIKTRLKTDAGITALANSITLTPGTLTVDLTDDGFLYVHWINVKSTDTEEATRLIAERFEYFLEKIFE